MKTQNLVKAMLLLFVLASSLAEIKSQSIINGKTSGYYTLIYKLDKAWSLALLKDRYLEINELLVKSSPVDSFLTDSGLHRKLPFGQYVYINAIQNSLYARYNPFHSFDLKVFNNGLEIIFLITSKSDGKIISDAVVHLDDEFIPFNSQTGTYRLRRYADHGNLKVEWMDEIACYTLSNSHYSHDNHYNNYYNYNRFDYYEINEFIGYMIFSKPRYLPKDTVKFKAFLINDNGKPVINRAIVSLRKAGDKGKAIILDTIKPITPGAYVFQFPLKDSLVLNYNYDIELRSVYDYRLFYKGSFYLEDYQLKEVKYHIDVTKRVFHRGEPVTIYASAIDANGLNILDGKLDIKTRLSNITDFYSPKIFIPNSLPDTSIVLEPFGETRIVIPDHLLPPARFDIEISAHFSNGNRETFDTNLVLTYDGNDAQISVKSDSQLLELTYLYRCVEQKKEGILLAYNGPDTVFKRKVNLPHNQLIDPRITSYEISCGNVVQEWVLNQNPTNVTTEAYRKKDSVFIKIDNPRQVEIFYSLFKNQGREVTKGRCKDLKFAIYDKSRASYHLKYHYVWGGKVYEGAETSHLYEKSLKILTDQPGEIYPGQKVKIHVKVLDYKEKPLNNVNLTAVAINAQFKDKYLPELPYLGEDKTELSSYNKISVTEKEFANTYSISENARVRLGLDTIPYYKMLYPPEGRYVFYEKTNTTHAQFAPFVYEKGEQVPVYFIYLDGKLVYYYNFDFNDCYSFITSAGWHNISFRTKNHWISSYFRLKKGYKLFISISLSDSTGLEEIKEKKPFLTSNEAAMINYSTLILKNIFWGKTVNVWQGNKFTKVTGYNNYYHLGPFSEDTVHFEIPGSYHTKFLFEPGYSYAVGNGLIKLFDYTYAKAGDLLPNGVSFKSFRDIASTKMDNDLWQKQAKNVKNNKLDAKYFNTPYDHNFPFNGTLYFKYTGDSVVIMSGLYKRDSSENCHFFYGREATININNTGYYTLLLFTANNYCLKTDSVLIETNGLNYLEVKNGQFFYIDSIERLLYIKEKASEGTTKYNFIPKEAKVIQSNNRYEVNKSYPGFGVLSGIVIDSKTHEPIPFVTVKICSNKLTKDVAITNMDGNYIIKPITPGVYDVMVSFFGYEGQKVVGMVIYSDRICYQNFNLEVSTISLSEYVVTEYVKPLVEMDRGSGARMSKQEIRKAPTRNVGSLVNLTAGVAGQSIKGQRGSGTVYFVDGVKVTGGLLIPYMAINELNTINGGIPGEYGDNKSGMRSAGYKGFNMLIDSDSLLFAKYGHAKKMRNIFADCGYWVPNLLTDENGEASFEVTFPDNITSWRSFVIGMDGKKHSGYNICQTRSFKPLLVNLALPRFLIEGDTVLIIGKIMNYTNREIHLKRLLKVRSDSVTKDTAVLFSVIEQMPVIASGKDTIKIEYSLQTDKNYGDGESREIPVFPAGTEESVGSFYYLNSDTVLSLNFTKSDGQITLYAEENVMDFMIRQLDGIRNYPYWCMEQTSSKLKGLLMEKKIKHMLGIKCNTHNEILKLITKLEKGQKPDGSWGWWAESPTNIYMTTYVTKSLIIAQRMGYYTPALSKGLSFIRKTLDGLDSNNLLCSLDALAESDILIPYKLYIEELEKMKLDPFQRLMLIKIKQRTGMDYKVNEILATKKETMLGNVYWGDDCQHWYNNSINLTILVFKILEAHDSLDPILPKISGFFLEYKNKFRWRNTLETTGILETILPSIIRKYGPKLKPAEMKLSGVVDETVSFFPYSLKLQSKEGNLLISKTGSTAVYLTVYRHVFNTKPSVVSKQFKVQSWFEVEGKKVNSLKAGQITEMVVQVNAKAFSNYMMIEIPIPGGCSYGDNKGIENYFEVHREYFRNKTSIFCESLYGGTYTFRIRLEPRFNGSFTLNPAKVESMYFPVLTGRNDTKKIKILNE